jgi:hypothetical protein
VAIALLFVFPFPHRSASIVASHMLDDCVADPVPCIAVGRTHAKLDTCTKRRT